MRRKRTPQDYHDLAAQFGNISWIDHDFPKTTKNKTLWLCLSCARKFQSNYNNVYYGHGCPECAKEKRVQTTRKKPDLYHQLANERDFIWLGSEVSSVMIPTSWQCKKCDHIGPPVTGRMLTFLHWLGYPSNPHKRGDGPLRSQVSLVDRCRYQKSELFLKGE